MLKIKHRYLMVGAWTLFLGSSVSGPLSAEDYPMAGTWVVDFKKTAESLGNEDKAKGFLNASQGIKLEMVYRPDGSVVFTKYYGEESKSLSGKYKIETRAGDEFVMEVMTPHKGKGIRFEQIYQAPQDFLDKSVLMKGTFREHYPKSESFGLAQGDRVLEVFYENLSDDQKAAIGKQQQGAEAPVAVAGILGKSSIEDDEVYYIEAKGIRWGKFRTDQLKVKLIDENHCQMDALGLGMRFIWQRIK